MAFKSLAFTGFFVVTMTSALALQAAPIQSVAYNENAQSNVILVQNDSGQKQGFFQKLFNKKNESSGSKPLFLDTKGIKPTGKNPKPYDFGKQARNLSKQLNNKNFEDVWEKFMAQKTQGVLDQLERANAITSEMSRQRQAAVDKKFAETRLANSSGVNKEKKMVYDPNKAKNYDPNQPDGNKKPRLYNPR